MGWEMVKLGDVAHWGSGGTPKRSVPAFFGDRYPWASITDLNDGSLFSTAEGLSEEGLQNSSAKLVPPGSILLAMYGSIGKLAINEVEVTTSQAIAFGIPDLSCIHRDYLFHFLRSERPKFLSVGRGGTQKNIGLGTVRNWLIPLPPLEEQQRIATILGTVEKAITDATTTFESISALRQSVFKTFVRPDHPTQELGEIVTIQSGGTPSKKKPEYWDGDIPWYSPKDFKARYLSDSIDHISELAVNKANAKILPARTPAVVVRGMILAHSFPVAVLETPGAINQDVKALHLNEDSIYSVDFLAEALRANAKYALTKVLTSSHGTKRLETEELAKLPVPVMSKDDIKEFDRVFSCLTQLAIYREEKVNRLHELYASLSSRAFAGEV